MTMSTRKPPPASEALDVDMLQATIAAHVRDLGPKVTTPVQVLDARPHERGVVECDVSVCWLVPLEDEQAGTCVPTPTGGYVCVMTDGSLESARVEPPGTEVEHEVRAWARNLFASGAVRGVTRSGPSFGPPVRPTHEMRQEDGCQRVLRRIGYSA